MLLLLCESRGGEGEKKKNSMFTGAGRRDVFFFYYLLVCVYVYKLILKKPWNCQKLEGKKAVFLIQSFCPFLLNNPLAFFFFLNSNFNFSVPSEKRKKTTEEKH